MRREVRPCLIREDFVAICAFVLREALHTTLAMFYVYEHRSSVALPFAGSLAYSFLLN
jgi:hypothetical protein